MAKLHTQIIPMLLSALLLAGQAGIIALVEATHSHSPTLSPSKAPTPLTTAAKHRRAQSSPSPTGPYMQFFNVNATQLINELIQTDGEVEIDYDDIFSSSHISDCSAMFTRGHTLGNLYQKDPITHQPMKDVNGDYIPTSTPIVPDTGIILSSGNPLDFNINDADDQTTRHDAGGDPDLKGTVDAQNNWNNAIFDACVLQFKFRCKNDAYVPSVQFKYIWGSEEYYEYVDSAFNDVFGFYLNGENIARLPTTDTTSDIVSINNVNYKDNAVYFNGNDPGTGWEQEQPDAPDTGIVYPTIEADGFTDTLVARGTPFSDAEEWNTIKLAVGDVGDSILDSWVVLEGASFTCVDITAAPSISRSPSDGELLLVAAMKEHWSELCLWSFMLTTINLSSLSEQPRHSSQAPPLSRHSFHPRHPRSQPYPPRYRPSIQQHRACPLSTSPTFQPHQPPLAGTQVSPRAPPQGLPFQAPPLQASASRRPMIHAVASVQTQSLTIWTAMASRIQERMGWRA